MEKKVSNPRYLYRVYTQKIDPETFQIVGERSPYQRFRLLLNAVLLWLQLTEKEGFDHLEVHVERRHGDKWVEISQLWGCFEDPSAVVLAHYYGLELVGYHLDWLEVDDQ